MRDAVSGIDEGMTEMELVTVYGLLVRVLFPLNVTVTFTVTVIVINQNESDCSYNSFLTEHTVV